MGEKKGLPTESGDLLAVLDQLDLDTLPNGGVGLLGLNTDLFENDTLGVGGTTEGRRLVGGSKKALLVVQVGPAVVTAGGRELARGVESSRLALTHLGVLCSNGRSTENREQLEFCLVTRRLIIISGERGLSWCGFCPMTFRNPAILAYPNSNSKTDKPTTATTTITTCTYRLK